MSNQVSLPERDKKGRGLRGVGKTSPNRRKNGRRKMRHLYINQGDKKNQKKCSHRQKWVSFSFLPMSAIPTKLGGEYVYQHPHPKHPISSRLGSGRRRGEFSGFKRKKRGSIRKPKLGSC